MSIADLREKCKALSTKARDILFVLILVFASSASFGLGYLTGRDQGGQGSAISIEPTKADDKKRGEEGSVVASKNGTKYYLPWCSGADRINESNKVWFNSINAARTAGYTPAANCTGL